jgi:hypothetical protein
MDAQGPAPENLRTIPFFEHGTTGPNGATAIDAGLSAAEQSLLTSNPPPMVVGAS